MRIGGSFEEISYADDGREREEDAEGKVEVELAGS